MRLPPLIHLPPTYHATLPYLAIRLPAYLPTLLYTPTYIHTSTTHNTDTSPRLKDIQKDCHPTLHPSPSSPTIIPFELFVDSEERLGPPDHHISILLLLLLSTPVVDEQYYNNCLFDPAADTDTQLQPSNRTSQEHHPRRANFRNTWLDRLRYAPLQTDFPGSFSLTAAVLVRRAASVFEPTPSYFPQDLAFSATSATVVSRDLHFQDTTAQDVYARHGCSIPPFSIQVLPLGWRQVCFDRLLFASSH